MRPPEMSYSPAYHQGQDPLGAAARNSIIAPLPDRSLESPDLSYPAAWRPSVDGTPYDGSPRSSGPRRSLAQSPEASRRSSRVDNESPVTRVVVSGGVIHKEERSRGSWADQPSLMSADHSGTPRTQKRGGPVDIPAVDSQDALLMIVSGTPAQTRLKGPPSPNTQLDIVPTLRPRPIILIRRLPVHLLRLDLRSPHLSSSPLPSHTIPPQYLLQIATMRPPLSGPTYPRAPRAHAPTIITPFLLHTMDPLRDRLRPPLSAGRDKSILHHWHVHRGAHTLALFQHRHTAVRMDSRILLGFHHGHGQSRRDRTQRRRPRRCSRRLQMVADMAGKGAEVVITKVPSPTRGPPYLSPYSDWVEDNPPAQHETINSQM